MSSLKANLTNKVVNVCNHLQDSNLVASFQNYFGVHRTNPVPQNGNACSSTADGCFVSSRRFEGEKLENGLPNCSGVVSSGSRQTKKGNKTNYVIKSQFWYYVFSFGTSLGYEMFYATFFPFWVWNLNAAICRRVVNVWVFVMYIGQALKDIICWPRPSSPPVVHMEPKYVQEYGMPSTHAMVSVALPFSFLYFTYQRYEYPLSVGLLLACTWCILVCCSRLYMGMHTVLDIIGGLLLSPILMIVYLPVSDAVDEFQMRSPYSPLATVTFMALLQVVYPKSGSYTPARGDTSVIMGTGTGFALGTWLGFRHGIVLGGLPPPPLSKIAYPSFLFVALSLLRTVLGLLCIVVARIIFKNGLYRMVCWIMGLDPRDSSCKQKARVEMPYKYLTYIVIGFVITYISPVIFQYFGIERSGMYTER